MSKRKRKKQSPPSPRPQGKPVLSLNRELILSAAILCCFFFSGMAGLVYEVLWVRLFDKVIGSAPFAVASVLTVFMAGLAGGSYLASRKVDRVAVPGKLLATYGLLECGIGLYGILLPLLTLSVKPLYVLLYNKIFHQFWLYNLISFVVCFTLLLLPVAFMGATLPILMKFYVRRLNRLGWRAGQLYGINTAGAAVGVILAGFFLIQRFGVWGTLFIVAGVNLGVGIIAILLGRRPSLGTPDLEATPVVEKAAAKLPAPSTATTPTGANLALLLFAVSGFSAMGYQVIWTRLIGLLIAPTTYSFSLVVATFIVGLALGNVIFGWLADRSTRIFPLLIGTQIAAALLALIASQFLGNSQLFFAKFIFAFKDQFGQMMFYQFLLLFLILLGPTILLGAAFPLVSKLYTTSLRRVGRSIGVAYTINTIGAILGSFTAGFILIPFMGKEGGLALIVAIQLIAGFLVWGTMALRSLKNRMGWVALAVAVVVAWIGVSNFPSWNRQLLSYGRYQNLEQMQLALMNTSWGEAIFKGVEILTEQDEGREIVFYGDGIGGFTTVEKQFDSIGNTVFTLLNSGKPDATSHGDAATQAILAHAPLLFHPDARKVMVLGAGSGMTAGEALLYPIDALDVLEINEQVIEASRFFNPWNNDYLKDARTRIIIQDGRNHLSLWDGRYDVVISEPSNPWMAGMANLYSMEFFRTVEAKLQDSGIFIQWVHAGRMDWPTMAMIGRTFSEVFPRNALMLSPIGASDYFLLGFKGDAGFDLATAQAKMPYALQSKVMKLKDVRLLYHLIVSEEIGKMFAGGKLHTDNWPRLEFLAPQNIYRKPGALEKRLAKRRDISPTTEEILRTTQDMDMVLNYVEFAASLYTKALTPVDLVIADSQQTERYYAIVADYCTNQVVDDYTQFADDRSREICSQIQIDKMQQLLESDPQNAFIYRKMGIVLARRGELEKSIEALDQSITLNPDDATTYYDMSIVLAMGGDLVASRESLVTAVAKNPSYADALVMMAKVNLQLKNVSEAEDNLKRALEIEEIEEARQILKQLQ